MKDSLTLAKKHPNRLVLMIGPLLIIACIFSSPAAASINLHYGFGSKVNINDFDAGNPLNNVCVDIGYSEIGEQHNIFDQMDVVYLDMDSNRIVSLNDIRLTPFYIFPPGSKVRQTEPDIDSHLIILLNWSVVCSDIGANDIYDLQDPVYLHNVSFGDEIAPGDIRLTRFWDFPAGSRVRGSDRDTGRPVFDLMSVNRSDIADIRFYNANGNYLGESPGNNSLNLWDVVLIPIYDSPDPVYMDISFSNRSSQAANSMGLVDANDLRLSI